MHLLFVGLPGQINTKVNEVLRKTEFTLVDTPQFELSDSLENRLVHFGKLIEANIKAHILSDRQNTMVAASPWDFIEISLSALCEAQEIVASQFDSLHSLYSSTRSLLNPPHAAVVVRNSNRLLGFDEALASGAVVSEVHYNCLTKNLDLFIQKLFIPVVEIDASKDFDEIERELTFGIASLRTSGVARQRVWKRTFFKGE